MKRTIVLLLAATSIGACIDRPADRVDAGEGTASTVADAPIADPIPCTVDGMRNCARTGDVILGAQPSPEALQTLAQQGVTTIVTARPDAEITWNERAAVEALGMRFVSIPMPSPVTEITDEQVTQLGAVLDGADGPVVLHCGSGNRISGLWAAWLVDERGMEPSEALRLAELAGMRSVRPAVERRLGVSSMAP
jgi:uncharacterized protein (TIGR01244 family)